MTKVKEVPNQAVEVKEQDKRVTSTIKLNCSAVYWNPGETYDTCECEIKGETMKETNDMFEVVVKAYLKDRAALHTFELSGSTEETFDGYIINFSPYHVSLILHE